jgi:phosphatidylethanolamine/phosphatidyl-N-methylethanolamine N-methyltransferase
MPAPPETSTAGAAWNRARYSAYAPLYDLLAAPFAAGRRRSIELLALRPGERLLIVGCGTGLDLPLLPAGVRVTAFDLTPAMARRAAAHAVALGQDVAVAVMNGQQVALASGAFDAALLHLVLAVVPDPIACAREVTRLLRPGGRAAIFDKWLPEGARPSPARRALNVVASAAFSDLNRQLGPILAAAGLQLVHREPVGLRGAYQAALAVAPGRSEGSSAAL